MLQNKYFLTFYLFFNILAKEKGAVTPPNQIIV